MIPEFAIDRLYSSDGPEVQTSATSDINDTKHTATYIANNMLAPHTQNSCRKCTLHYKNLLNAIKGHSL